MGPDYAGFIFQQAADKDLPEVATEKSYLGEHK